MSPGTRFLRRLALLGPYGLAVLAAAGSLAAARPPAPGAVPTLVVCAPGYPGSTAEAQPAMNALAAAVSQASGLGPAGLEAAYYETEKAGLDRLAAPDAALALVPLPFWLEHGKGLRLEPVMQAIEQGGQAAEPWTLVAAAGAVATPASLAGFEISSLAGYSPRFVRGPVLGAWGDLPRDATIVASSAVLTSLRRASVGNKVAVLLDRAQAASLASLPFAGRLQVVTRSAPLPVSVLCVVGNRVPPSAVKALVKGFASLGATKVGAEALAGVRLARFVPADRAALAGARAAFDRVKE
jgi:hypothetical protein